MSKQKFPDDFLSGIGIVTHIWTQNKNISISVSEFANIKNIVDEPEEMIGKVDAVLLARDDAENHYAIAKVFIENEVPIFIDKPLAFGVEEAKKIYSLNESSLIFTCSSLRYAKEFSKKILNPEPHYVTANIMKSWEKYGIHIVEPVVSMFPYRGKLINVSKIDTNLGVKVRTVDWENLSATFTTTHTFNSQVCINIMKYESSKSLLFEDVFYAFRESLIEFIDAIKSKELKIPKKETLEIIEIIEKGM